MLDLPERRGLVYVSGPWAKVSYAILYADELHLKRASDLAGSALATTSISADLLVAPKFFPSSPVSIQADTRAVTSAVCSGKNQ